MYKTIVVKDKEIKFDPDDYEIARNHNWHFIKNRLFTKINNQETSVAKILFNTKDDEFLYHKNGDSFDYRKENLEFMSRAHYSRFLIKQKKSSNFYNVCYDKNFNMWSVYVVKDKNQFFGGRYYNEIDAAIVADYLNYSLYSDMEKANFIYDSIEEMIQKYEFVIERYGANMAQRISRTHQGKVQKKMKEKTSSFVGVSKHQGKRKCWCVEIRKDKKRHSLGYYLTEEEAARVYDKKALELYGEDANTNFPKEDYLEILRALSDLKSKS